MGENVKTGEVLYIVVPCYNEEPVINETTLRLNEKLYSLIKDEKISNKSKILFVNDGSKDKTWSMIKSLHKDNETISGINLSRNRGHQNALLAGLMYAKNYADMVISMDADLQDDIGAVDEMISYFHKGIDIVYGVRNKREQDTFFKRFTAEGFYRIMNSMGVETVFNHADYRLMSKRALEGMEQFREVNLFLRGIVPMIGYSSAIVYYERGERFAGESKYPLSKMVSFAIEGITSCTTYPLKLVSYVGGGIFLGSFIILIYSLIAHSMSKTIQGWTSIMLSIWSIGGLVLLAIGIIGEYIGKIYLETKDRPRYIYEDILDKF